MDRPSSSNSTEPLFTGFIVKEKLGQGSFSSVYRAIEKVKKEVVAIKCIDKTKISRSGAQSIIREIQILKMLEHPFIVKMLNFYWDDKYVYIVLEYCNGGDLSKYIKEKQKIPESICKKFMMQLIEGLKYLRSKDIYHYDLKPQNILIQNVNKDEGLTLKISDFGLSLFANAILEFDKLDAGPRGSPSYMAPEMLLCDHYDPALIDLWSLGVVLYECLHGKHPLPHQNVEELVMAEKENKPIKVDVKLSDDCKSLLRFLLSYDPKKRIRFEQMLKHPFVQLEYSPPTEESYRKAIKLEREAVKLDFDQEYRRAFNKYLETLKYMVPFVTKEGQKGSSSNETIETEGTREEELEQPTVLCGNSSSESELPYGAKTEPSHLTSHQVAQLKKMAKATPKMYDGLDVGYAAQMYLYEGNYVESLDKFMLALSILVPALRIEPCGRRKELLKIQIKEWLEQAESVKTLLSANNEIRKLGNPMYAEDKEEQNVEDFCKIQ